MQINYQNKKFYEIKYGMDLDVNTNIKTGGGVPGTKGHSLHT
jgi:hypothetical protein